MKRVMMIGCTLCLMASLGACSMMGASVWTDAETRELRIDAAGVNHLYVETHNGFIKHRGREGGEAAVLATVTIKGGGRSAADAQEALEAIEVFAEEAPGGIRKLGWRWTKPKADSWGANVSFDVSAPAGLVLDARTHNGAVQVADVRAETKISTHNGAIKAEGIGANLRAESYNGRLDIECQGDDVLLVTHNGAISADCIGTKLRAESYNGRLDVKYQGKGIVLETHNGVVAADLTACQDVGGSIVTYNGDVLVRVGERTAADCTLETYNGRLGCDVPGELAENLEALRREKKRGSRCISGKLGEGGHRLTVTTHNGGVEIMKPTAG